MGLTCEKGGSAVCLWFKGSRMGSMLLSFPHFFFFFLRSRESFPCGVRGWPRVVQYASTVCKYSMQVQQVSTNKYLFHFKCIRLTVCYNALPCLKNLSHFPNFLHIYIFVCTFVYANKATQRLRGLATHMIRTN